MSPDRPPRIQRFSARLARLLMNRRKHAKPEQKVAAFVDGGLADGVHHDELPGAVGFRLSADGKRAYFGARGEVWTATRASMTSPFENLSTLPSLLGDGKVFYTPAGVSADGCRLYVLRQSVAEGAPRTLHAARSCLCP